MSHGLKHALVDQARALGFDAIGITAPDSIAQAPPRLGAISSPPAIMATMDWLAADAGAPRRSARAVARGALGDHARGQLRPRRRSAGDPARNAIAARSRSMRRATIITTLIKTRLKAAGALADRDRPAATSRCSSTPRAVMEKPLAQAAGLGWQGKHTNLVSREFGSWLFLGAIFTTLELPRDAAERRSLRLVPRLPRRLPDRGVSGAVPARCAALHLLSHHRAQGPDPARIPPSASATASMAATIASPSARGTSSRRPAARPSSPRARHCARRRSRELARLDDAAFRALFTKSPVKRIGRDRFVRNVLIAIGNSGDAGLAARPSGCSPTPSPLVRGAAVWALSQLLPADQFAALAAWHRR